MRRFPPSYFSLFTMLAVGGLAGLGIAWLFGRFGMIFIMIILLEMTILLLPAYEREQKRMERRRLGLCLGCGYDLTGNRSGICPECGKQVKHT